MFIVIVRNILLLNVLVMYVVVLCNMFMYFYSEIFFVFVSCVVDNGICYIYIMIDM